MLQNPQGSTQRGNVASHLPLSTLLSQVLVAFTIEFDNESEHQMPHRTSNHGSTSDSRAAPWLVSLVMWCNCLQFVSAEGITIAELQRLARTDTNLDGMRRWGYIIIEPGTTSNKIKQLHTHPDSVVRSTPAGRKAQEILRPLFGVIEERWQARFGRDEIARLRAALWALVSQIDIELPDCLPILGYGLFSRAGNPGADRQRKAQVDHEEQALTEELAGDENLPLLTLLSRVLLTFAIAFERKSNISLAISANVLRVLNEQGIPMRDLPLLSGVSKEAINMALGILQKHHLATIEPDPHGSRFKIARLTSKGQEAQHTYHQLLAAIEERWQTRFGKDNIRQLRASLERLVGSPTAEQSPLFKGLEPYPEGWRASVRKPDTLPHYPMILHRGGFPDGS